MTPDEIIREPAMTEAQLAEIKRLKLYFPYRIVYGALNGSEFKSGAVMNKRAPNELAKKGWQVWLL